MSTLPSEPNESTNLSLEQQFTIVHYNSIAKRASKEQLLELYSQLLGAYLSQKNYYEALVKHSWGIDSGINKRNAEEERFSEGTDY